MDGCDLKFVCLASGSSGNCYYVGTHEGGILVDAGIPVRTIKRRLKTFSIDIATVQAIFVTHDHSDHIRSVGIFAEVLHIPIYATEKVHHGIDKNYIVTQKVPNISRKLIKVSTPIFVAGLTVMSFFLPHDSSENVGYCIEYRGKKLTIATDLGFIPKDAVPFIAETNYLVIESNYDEKMLSESRYPYHLRNRISSDYGHLSNRVASEFLSEIYTPKLKVIFLCHLSKENNTRELAYETTAKALYQKGIEVGKDVNLYTLERTIPSELFLF